MSIELAELEESLFGGTTARRGQIVFSSGQGCWLLDTEGNRYLDMTSAQGVAMLGHSHPGLTAAIQDQAAKIVACPSFVYNETRARYAQALRKFLPADLNHVFLANSGAEAIDGALKMARLVTKRLGVVAFRKAFHGRTVGAVSTTWEPKYREPFEPLLPVRHVPYNNLTKLEEALDDTIGAVILEVVQGEGGVNIGDSDFLRGAQELCHRNGSLLILDEIQTGFGRTSKWFGLEHHGLKPDLLCLAKGLGAGFPMGAFAFTDQVQEVLYPGAHGSTFGGNPLACAAGIAAIEAYQSGVIEGVEAKGQYLLAGLRKALEGRTCVREIRGVGLMIGIELREKSGPYLKALMEQFKVLALPAGPNVLRLLPPLIVSEEEMDLAIAAISGVLP